MRVAPVLARFGDIFVLILVSENRARRLYLDFSLEPDFNRNVDRDHDLAPNRDLWPVTVTHLSGEHHDAGQRAGETEHALEEQQRVGEPNSGAHIVEKVADAVGQLPAADPHDVLLQFTEGEAAPSCGQNGK